MKTLLITFLLALLPITNQTNNSVVIYGNIDPRPGETTILTVDPYSDSYTYVWDCDGNWESLEQSFDITISGNQITIAPKEMKTQLVNMYCTVYDEKGNSIGNDMAEVIWHW